MHLMKCDRREDPTTKIGESLMRIFAERGHDFFEKETHQTETDKADEVAKEDSVRDETQPMTPEELFKMRGDILGQLQ